MRVNAASLHIRAATTSTSGTLNDLTTDLIMANNNSIAQTNWSNLVAVTDWGGANSRFLGLVCVGSYSSKESVK